MPGLDLLTFRSLMGKTESFMKNSAHFVEKISGIKPEDSDLVVRFDVESLFT